LDLEGHEKPQKTRKGFVSFASFRDLRVPNHFAKEADMQRFTIACAQFAITPMAVKENVQKAVAWVERAVQETGAQLVVLPETITTGFCPGCPAE